MVFVFLLCMVSVFYSMLSMVSDIKVCVDDTHQDSVAVECEGNVLSVDQHDDVSDTEMVCGTDARMHDSALSDDADTKDADQELLALVIDADEDEVPFKAVKAVTITNSIEQSSLGYKHWTGTYTPEKFIVYINGVELKVGESCLLTDSNQPVTVQFDYCFSTIRGNRAGAKKVVYQLNENIEAARITFSWLDSYKIILDNATAVSQEDITV